MIICLYESDYPVNKTGKPDWKSLPIGYFQINREGFEDEMNKENPTFKGRFFFIIILNLELVSIYYQFFQ